jgi:hypothetical protein
MLHAAAAAAAPPAGACWPADEGGAADTAAARVASRPCSAGNLLSPLEDSSQCPKVRAAVPWRPGGV